VSSIYLAAVDGTELPAARGGQYLTLRITGAGHRPLCAATPCLRRLTPVPTGSASSRISVKHEPHGTASSYLNSNLRPGAVLDVAAPRGDFVLEDSTGSCHTAPARGAAQRAGHLVAAWGTRTADHPFAAEAHALLISLPHAREHVFYGAATPRERHRAHAAPGRLTKDKLAGLAIPASAGAYLCGPASFIADMRGALTAIGVDPRPVRVRLRPRGLSARLRRRADHRPQRRHLLRRRR